MAKLVKAVFVKDPDRHRTVLLRPGEEPESRFAALVTNPDAWEDGKLPEAAAKASEQETDSADNGEDSGGDEDKAAPAAKKTAAKKATTSRSRGRDAADEGTSGD
ncbi:hypothetical protein [Streptomyces griseosporeus]|uniref:hypothetical protein n=1 Tax=Streptomyces griseosporeus TaxID=1910 RepID=UPI0037023C07